MFEPDALSHCLGRIRQRVRRLVWVNGISRVVTIVIGLLLVIGLADWLVHFDDPGLRLILLLAVVGLTIWSMWRHLLAPLSSSFSNADAAARIERRFPGFKDSLASTVQFLEEGADERLGSPELQKRVISETLQQLQSVDLADVIDSKPVRSTAYVAALVCVIAGILVAVDLPASRLALQRLTFPYAEHAWPRRTSLRLLDARLHPVAIPEGEPLRVIRGREFSLFVEDANGRPPDDVRLEVQIADGDVITTSLRRASLRDLQGEAREVFALRLPTETGPVRFRVLGGDDDTMRLLTLEIIPPPVVEELQVQLTPPAYSRIPPSKLPEGTGHLQAILGTHVEVAARFDRPVVEAELQIGQQPVNLMTIANDGCSVHTAFTVAQEGIYSYGFHLKDALGFEFDDVRYEIRARSDLVPQVTIDVPQTDLNVTVNAQVPVRITARDDLSLNELRLRYQIGESSDHAAGIQLPLEGERNGPVSSEYFWSMAELGVKEGMKVDFHAEATDDYNLGAEHVGKSPHRSLTIVSHDEKANEIASMQLALLEKLQTIREAQAHARDQTSEIATQWEKAGELKDGDFDSLTRVDLEQRRIARQLEGDEQGVIEQARKLTEDLEANRVKSIETSARLTRILGELSHLSRDRFPEIERNLTDALKDAENTRTNDESADAGRQEIARHGAATLDAVRQGQESVVEGLDALLRDLGRWRNQRELESEIEELIARQKNLNRDTADVGKRTLSRPSSDLTLQEQADLARLAERQMQQAERLEKFSDALGSAAAAGENDERNSSEVFTDTQQRLDQQAASVKMRDVAERLKSNRIGDAAGTQQSVLRDLEELEQMLKQPAGATLDTQLARMREVETDIAGLRKKQKQVAEGAESLTKQKNAESRQKPEELRKSQQEAREQAQKLEPKLRRLEANRAQQSIQRAQSRMQQAEVNLAQGQNDGAAENAGEAAEDLAQTQRELATKRRELEERLAHETLEKMSDLLQGMIARQQSVVDETLRLDGERAKRGTWSRSQLKSLAELAGNQMRLKEETDQMAAKVADAAVFAAALRSAASEMSRAAQRIEKRNTDASTVAAERRARQRFVDLAAALEEPKLNSDEQQRTEDPAENGPQEGSPPPSDVIALLAQLKLLKAMQVELVERTATLDQLKDTADIAKKEMADEAAALAEEQSQLVDLAQQLAGAIAQRPATPDAPEGDAKEND